MPVGCFISPGRDLSKSLGRVRRADELGFDAVYTTHTAGRDSLSVLMAFAAHSGRIKLGTGVLPIFSRTPVATAQQAATIDEFSSGRMVLGLGVSHQVTVEHWYGSKIDKPVTQMRHYVEAVRAMLHGVDPPESSVFPTKFRFMGYEARAELPIYIAALSPNMLKLAAQIGDGVMLWLCSPVVHPRRRRARDPLHAREEAGLRDGGLRHRRGRPGRAHRRPRRRARLAAPGADHLHVAAVLSRDARALGLRRRDRGFRRGDGRRRLEKAKAGISDAMLDELAGDRLPTR